MEFSTKELRQKTKEILDLVDTGEQIIITYRGKKKAKIVPISLGESKGKTGFGMWKDNPDIQDSSDYVRKLRKGRFP